MGLREMLGFTPEGVENNPAKLGSVSEYIEKKAGGGIIDEAGSDLPTMEKQYQAHKNLAEILQ